MGKLTFLIAMKSNSIISSENHAKIYPHLEIEISKYISQLKSDTEKVEFIEKLGPGQDNAFAAMINKPELSLPSVFASLLTLFPIKPKTMYERLCENFALKKDTKLKK